MSYANILLTSSLTAVGLGSVLDLSPGQLPALQNLENFFSGLSGGNQMGLLSVNVGAVQATATLTSTGAASAAETLTIANVVFTARASGATGNEFNVSATVGTQATNIAAAINASSNLTGIVTASAALGVVTLTAVQPGIGGNGLQISETLTNVALSAFAGGSNGTSYSLDFR